MSRRIRLRARAKVNLTLEVLHKREDGYHELSSVMALVDLADDVRVAPSRALEVRIRPPIGVPRGADLASKAARALANATGREARARIEIGKRIPLAAGLGGGSSDAAAVLRALASLWRLEGVDLPGIGASVGSDVPFFAAGHAVARIGGRGERVQPLPPPRSELWIVLVTLPIRLATASVFAAHDEGARSEGTASAAVARALEIGTLDPATLREHARNDLTAAAEQVCPAIAEVRAAAEKRGITLTMSGSGPSMFAIADDRAGALRVARSLRSAGVRARPMRAGGE